MKPPQIKNYDLGDSSRISKGIPDSVKLLIANAIMAFAEMEVSAELVLWKLAGLSTDDGKLLTQLDSKEKFELTKKFSERYQIPIHAHPQTTSDIWSQIRMIVEARNKVAHGVWVMIDGNMPMAVTYRIPTGLGRIMGEHFPEERLALIAENCWKIKRLFDEMADHIASLPERPTPRNRQEPEALPALPKKLGD
jgi:hypothetical protein